MEGRARAPGVYLHHGARRLLFQHASARDSVADLMTSRASHPALVWNHVGLVVNRTTLSYYKNGTLANVLRLDGDDEFTWTRSDMPLTDTADMLYAHMYAPGGGQGAPARRGVGQRGGIAGGGAARHAGARARGGRRARQEARAQAQGQEMQLRALCAFT
jgi:hypothetical protein